MRIATRKIALLFLISVGVIFYWTASGVDKQRKEAINALSSKGVVVNVSIIERVKSFTTSKNDPYDFYYKIKYTEHNSGKVVERFVKECEHNSYISCLGMPAKTPLKMLYVPGDENMWTDCSHISLDKKTRFCSRSESTGYYALFTFELDKLKKSRDNY